MFGKLLKDLLVPVGITVHTSFAIIGSSPEVDVLLLQRENDSEWTDEQYAWLPDGIR